MKKIIIYGEFLERSTTGIAYINSLLKQVLIDLDNEVTLLKEPRSKDYNQENGIVNKKFYLVDFIRIFIKTIFLRKKDLSFITISQSNLGLIKTLIISLILRIKTKKLYIYVHRGDLHINYENIFLRRFLINLLFRLSYKVIFLSSLISHKFKKSFYKKKFLIIPNSLNKNDTKKTNALYFKNFYKKTINSKGIYRVLYAGNLQPEKGLDSICSAIKIFNKNIPSKKITLDVYGIPFQKLIEIKDQIKYKGILNYENRLEVMSRYDFLIIASRSEGMPMILIECLAIGLPFITSKVGAIEDILINDYPYTCSPDSRSILKSIERIIYDIDNKQEKLKRIIALGHDLYINKFQFIQFYQNIKNKILNN
tara:strand:- start:1347 stop:2447 length:1101 start_codon:yes stop_codon:yes gene_type:complete